MAGDGLSTPAAVVASTEGIVPEVGVATGPSLAPVAVSEALEPTIYELAVKHAFPKNLVDSLLEALGADADTSLEDILGVPDVTIQESIRAMKREPHGDVQIAPIAQGKVRNFLSKIRGPPPAPPAAAPLIVHVPVPSSTPSATKRKLSDVLDQVDSETTYELLDPAALSGLRAAYEKVCGGPPPDSSMPSSAQISALKTRLSLGTAPYVDFAVFGDLKRLLGSSWKAKSYPQSNST